METKKIKEKMDEKRGGERNRKRGEKKKGKGEKWENAGGKGEGKNGRKIRQKGKTHYRCTFFGKYFHRGRRREEGRRGRKICAPGRDGWT